MSVKSLNAIVERAREGMDSAVASSARVNKTLTRADRVMALEASRDGPARAAARRERQRLNSGLMNRVIRVGVAIGVISLLTIGVAALLAFMPDTASSAKPPPIDLPNGEMVQRFDSYIYRSRAALPAPAQSELDAISAALPSLRQTLERVDELDSN